MKKLFAVILAGAMLVSFADLNKPETEGECCGAFYIQPDEQPEGIYDIVFVKDGKAVAMMAANS